MAFKFQLQSQLQLQKWDVDRLYVWSASYVEVEIEVVVEVKSVNYFCLLDKLVKLDKFIEVVDSWIFLNSNSSIKFKLKNETLTAFRGQHHGLNLNLMLEFELKKCQLLFGFR